MTKITTTHISEVFKSLSSSASKGRQSTESKTSKTPELQHTATRNAEHLKQSIRTRLKGLQKQAPDFEKQAQLAAIQEVFFWEFGEDILNHNDFKHISRTVTESLVENDELKMHLAEVIDTLSE
ncbi:MAG: hypothetical protein COA42_16905 [Alteromonadaceae bacterium]|nr:MAG: hypothetical protein COA42_16905 [Alteromonadaceae bacterium]